MYKRFWRTRVHTHTVARIYMRVRAFARETDILTIIGYYYCTVYGQTNAAVDDGVGQRRGKPFRVSHRRGVQCQ